MALDKITPEIDALLQEDRKFAPPPEFAAAAHVSDPAVYERAEQDPEAFWAGFASELEWSEPWTQVLDWIPDSVWADLKREALVVAQAEPWVASLVIAVVIRHNSLAGALS